MQFLTTEEARTASSALNGKAIDGQHNLVALLSDPDAKKNRSGATAEGRELHVGNVDHNSTDEEIREAFQEFGQIDNLRRIKSANGKFTGTLFIIYANADQAKEALALNSKPLGTRVLKVSLATDKSSRDASNQKASSTTLIRGSGNAGSPEPSSTAGSPPAGDTPSNNGVDATDELGADTARTKRDRTLAIINLPDTVNDARIQSFLEPHGQLRKISIRRDKDGALVEFVNLEDAGRIGMTGLDCSGLGPDCRIGQASELMGRKQSGRGGKNAATDKIPFAPPLRPSRMGAVRPQQRGAKRGGLGFRRGGFGGGGASKNGEDAAMSNDVDAAAVAIGPAPPATNGRAKSNADFKAMFMGTGAVEKDV